MASKWKKRAKKLLKNVAKVAAIGGAGYLGAKAFGGRKRPVRGVVRPGTNPSLAMLGETVHPKWGTGVPDRVRNVASGAKSGPNTWRDYIPNWFGKKGGRVTGIAKRGFGRALMKGKK